jgi:hypothetical protein
MRVGRRSCCRVGVMRGVGRIRRSTRRSSWLMSTVMAVTSCSGATTRAWRSGGSIPVWGSGARRSTRTGRPWPCRRSRRRRRVRRRRRIGRSRSTTRRSRPPMWIRTGRRRSSLGSPTGCGCGGTRRRPARRTSTGGRGRWSARADRSATRMAGTTRRATRRFGSAASTTSSMRPTCSGARRVAG